MAVGAVANRKAIDMNDLSTRISILPCLHRNLVLDTTGGMHFSDGEVWDDIQERLLCLDCMEFVTEAEIRSARGEGFPNFNLTLHMEVSNDHA